MKKTILLFLFVLLRLAHPADGSDGKHPNGPALRDPSVRVYEAEEAALLDQIRVVEDASAGGGKFLRMEDTGAVLFHVQTETAGRYALGIRFRAAGGGKAQRLLINGIEYAPEIGFPAGEDWNEIETKAGLNAGTNTLELRKSWGHMDIDSITVRGPVTDNPEITPTANTFYQNQTKSDLFIQVEKNQNQFLSVTLNQKPVPFEQEEIRYLQDAVRIRIPRDYLEGLKPGTAELEFRFQDAKPIVFRLDVRTAPPKADLTIVSLDVSHGASVLFLLPTGKVLLVDTGTETMCKERVIPFLRRHKIKPDYLWITHYHDDHVGGKDLLMEKYDGLALKDYRDFTTDDEFEFENVKMAILNSYPDGDNENTRSLSFRMEYKGFVYTHGADIYGQNQAHILQRYAERKNLDFLQTHVYHANHHFHGSVDTAYLKRINPVLILVSAEEHVYGRSAYTRDVQQQVYPYLKEHKWFIEDLLSFEVGHIVIRVTDGSIWNYETYKDLDTLIPGLSR